MTPHGLIEDIIKCTKTGAIKYWHTELLIEAVETLATAVHFEMGPTRPLTPHVQFGHDMLAKGLFRLPFDRVFFTADCLPKTGICIAQEVDGDRLKRLHWYTCAPAMSSDGVIAFDMPSLWGELVVADGETNLIEHGTVNWKSMTVDPHRSRKDRSRVWGPDDYHEASEKVLNFVEGAVAMLMSKDIDVETVASPDRLNKHRIAKGRFPVQPKWVIRIKPEKRALYRAAAESDGGTVRMHFRRGHFRELAQPRKRDGEQIVPVAPAIVGAGGTDDAHALAKKYEVRP